MLVRISSVSDTKDISCCILVSCFFLMAFLMTIIFLFHADFNVPSGEKILQKSEHQMFFKVFST